MAPWLEREWFPGEWISAERAGASWVGEAWFDGIVVFATWSRAAVAALLPPEWIAATDASIPADGHPVAFLAGRQHTTAVLFAGARLPTHADYGEAMMLLPFVHHRTDRFLHSFVPFMYSGDARATWSGNAHYGFAKRTGAVERLGRSVVVTGADARLVIHATIHEAGPWCASPDASATPRLTALQMLGRCPVVGRRHDGRDIVSYFDWNLDHATVRPIMTTLSIDDAGAVGVSQNGRLSTEESAVEVRGLRWRLSWPVASRR